VDFVPSETKYQHNLQGLWGTKRVHSTIFEELLVSERRLNSCENMTMELEQLDTGTMVSEHGIETGDRSFFEEKNLIKLPSQMEITHENEIGHNKYKIFFLPCLILMKRLEQTMKS
jgi:hypothetical protein